MRPGMLTRSKLFHTTSPRNAWVSEVPWSMESRMRHRTKTRENIERLWTDHVGSSPTPFSQGHPPASTGSVSADGGWFFGKIEVMSLWAWGHQAQWRMGWNRAASKVTCTPKQWHPNLFPLTYFRTPKSGAHKRKGFFSGETERP